MHSCTFIRLEFYYSVVLLCFHALEVIRHIYMAIRSAMSLYAMPILSLPFYAFINALNRFRSFQNGLVLSQDHFNSSFAPPKTLVDQSRKVWIIYEKAD